MSVNWKLLGEDLRSSRDSHRDGVRAFAKKVGLSSSTLSRLENGREASVDVFLKATAWLAHPVTNKYVKP